MPRFFIVALIVIFTFTNFESVIANEGSGAADSGSVVVDREYYNEASCCEEEGESR